MGTMSTMPALWTDVTSGLPAQRGSNREKLNGFFIGSQDNFFNKFPAEMKHRNVYVASH